ncbi:zinc metallopeptidase, partial [Staphylococcus epidermidis]|uniref:zinc metallopeptidase n=1 Tax=Staphylococcus epidermidis TaxID=1282 RepID=UPI0021B3E48D
MSLPLLFSILTLPLHFNPTSTPIKQITPLNILNHKQYKHPKKLLSPPAITYVPSTALALPQLPPIILIP